MRTAMTAILVGFALLATASPALAGKPEVQRIYFMQNWSTGDQGNAACADARGNYSSAQYYIDLYRSLNDAETGTAGWYGNDVYKCTIASGARTDEYMTIYSNCAYPNWGYDYNQCTDGYYDNYGYYYCTSYAWTIVSYSYGSMVGWIGRTLAAAWDSNNVALYLATRTAKDQGGIGWSELIVLPDTALSAYGASAILFLGYAKGDYVAPKVTDGKLKSAYDQCVEGSGCFGACGVNCEGIFGKLYYTDGCLAHDRCVCQNGGNIWAFSCLGDFAWAAASYVAQAVADLVKTVVGWIVNAVRSIVRFLCFWC